MISPLSSPLSRVFLGRETNDIEVDDFVFFSSFSLSLSLMFRKCIYSHRLWNSLVAWKALNYLNWLSCVLNFHRYIDITDSLRGGINKGGLGK